MIFCGKRVNGHIEFIFTNEEFKYMCENTNSYFLGVMLTLDEPARIDGIFWLNHYQFEILWELDQISDRRFLRVGEKGIRKLCVLAKERNQQNIGMLARLSLLRGELVLDEWIEKESQKSLIDIINHSLTYLEKTWGDSKAQEVYYSADVFLLQGEDNQKHQLRDEQMSLLEFSQRKEVSPFISHEA